MEVDGLDGEEIEEDELHAPTPMKTSAVRKSVTRSSKKSFATTEPGSTWIPSWSRRRCRKSLSSRDDREAADQHPMGGCEQRVNGVAICPMAGS